MSNDASSKVAKIVKCFLDTSFTLQRLTFWRANAICGYQKIPVSSSASEEAVCSDVSNKIKLRTKARLKCVKPPDTLHHITTSYRKS